MQQEYANVCSTDTLVSESELLLSLPMFLFVFVAKALLATPLYGKPIVFIILEGPAHLLNAIKKQLYTHQR